MQPTNKIILNCPRCGARVGGKMEHSDPSTKAATYVWRCPKCYNMIKRQTVQLPTEDGNTQQSRQ